MLAQATSDFVGPPVDWWAISPLLVLLGGGLFVLVGGALARSWPKGLFALATVATSVAAIVLSILIWDDISDGGDRFLIADALRFDRFTLFITITICAAVGLAALLTDDFLRREDAEGPEVYGLYLMCAIGGVVMAAANDLVVLFLGLETLSIALYVLAASNRKRPESQESGLKYFVLGGFSSAFLLYGIALVYGATGTTHITSSPAGEPSIFATLETTIFLGDSKTLLLAGLALMIVGLSFKIAAVPFHWWTPDVYQGAPTPVTAFMASAAKAAGFAAMIRVLTYGMSSRLDDWQPVMWVIAVLTMFAGSVLAIVQTNVKRMLAYSSISHAGFILVGVVAANERGVGGALFYLLTYGILVIGTFGVVTLIGRTGDHEHELDAYRGLGRRRPILAFTLTILLLAQAGVPLTSGFVAKFGVIAAAVDAESYVLAVAAMLSAVIAAYLYLRIIVSMYLADPEPADADREPVRVPLAAGLAITISLAFTLLVGFFPGWLIDLARDAVPQLGLTS